ncbi:putative cysteine--tRNA ligase, mitochondrial isoform X1 [Lampetra planeri]
MLASRRWRDAAVFCRVAIAAAARRCRPPRHCRSLSAGVVRWSSSSPPPPSASDGVVVDEGAAEQEVAPLPPSSPPRRGAEWTRPRGHETGARVHNGLTRAREPLVLARDRLVTWYSCGPTVYDHAHLGHACSYVRFDIIRRILTAVFDVDVIMAMVITDIDDKIIKRARELDMTPDVLARMYEEDFKQDMASLNVLPPAVYMRVTDNVGPIVSFIERIVAKGHAYVTPSGNVYFDVQSIGERYGRLRRVLTDVTPEAEEGEKRGMRDFALWKAAKTSEPSWDSPWGPGRPGWHIECSAIASLVFGSQLDIHTGGIDLEFPHHENEIAQSEAYHGCEQWANYFMHSGHLHLKGSEEKMSKSLKNFITVKEFLQNNTANHFRMFCLMSRYRSAVEYSEDSVRAAVDVLDSLFSFLSDARAYVAGTLHTRPIDEAFLWERLAEARAAVRAALADDMDTPRAISALITLVQHAHRQMQTASPVVGAVRSPSVLGAIAAFIERMMETWGLQLRDAQQVAAVDAGPLAAVLDHVVAFRSEVRDFALAGDVVQEERRGARDERRALLDACDRLRERLASCGIELKDRGNASTWRHTETGVTDRGTGEGE